MGDKVRKVRKKKWQMKKLKCTEVLKSKEVMGGTWQAAEKVTLHSFVRTQHLNSPLNASCTDWGPAAQQWGQLRRM